MYAKETWEGHETIVRNELSWEWLPLFKEQN